MDKRQKICIAVIVIAIIVAGISLWYVNKDNTTEETSSNKVSDSNKNSVTNNNVNTNEESDDEVDTNTDTQDLQETDETNTVSDTSTYVGVEESDTNEEETEMTEEEKKEKAIELAKSEWGDDSNVYFRVENINGNMYYISVRSTSNSAALSWYEVDADSWTINEYI